MFPNINNIQEQLYPKTKNSSPTINPKSKNPSIHNKPYNFDSKIQPPMLIPIVIRKNPYFWKMIMENYIKKRDTEN